MINWLRPPQINNEYERVGYYALHYTLQIIFVLGVIIIFPPKTLVHLTLGPVLLGTILACYILLHKHYLQIAASVFVICLWLIITGSVVMMNGLYNSSVMLYVIVIIFSNVLFNRRGLVYFVTGLTILTITLVMLAESYDILPIYANPIIGIDRYLILVVVFGSTGILLGFASLTLRQSLHNLQESEKSLQMRNQALEILTNELLISEERYRLLFNNASVMATIYNRQGEILFANQAVADLHGLQTIDLGHISIHDLLMPADVERALNQQEEAFKTGKPTLIEGHAVLQTGREVDYLRHAIPLPHSGNLNKQEQILVLTTDLTDQRWAQKRQQELNAAKEKIQFFTEFFGTVSHDIKTPLAIMETSLYLLERLKDEPRKQEKINQIRHQVKILETYIQDMLLISRLDHVPQLDRKSVDMNRLIFDVMTILYPKCEQKGIHCPLVQPLNTLMVSIDEGQIRRVLMNLIENAINYTPDAGIVKVEASKEAADVLVLVSDTGIGIPADDIPHIFEPFYRSLEAKRVLSSGTGLGLAIVKRIVDLHQGSITVESQPQQGTTFLLRLPTL